MEIEKIYYDLSADKAYRSDKTEIANDNIPQFRYKGKKQIQWQFLNSARITNNVFDDVHLGLASIAVAGSTSIDNNAVHYYDGKPNATITKAVAATTIVIKELEGAPRICGRLRLTNAAGETETINYNGFTVSGTTYTFTLASSSYVAGAQTPTYTYLATDACRVLEIPIVKDATLDITGKATGLFVTTLDCFKLVYQDLIEGKDEIAGCKLEIIIKDSTPENIMVKQIPVKCFGIQDDDGDIGPVPEDNYYDSSEVDAVIRQGRTFQFSVDGLTLWHETQAPEDRYLQEAYPGGEWSVAIKLFPGADGAKGDDGDDSTVPGPAGETPLFISGTFTAATLSSGILTITHTSGNVTLPFAISDNNGKNVTLDSSAVTFSNNSIAVNLAAFGTISGTWKYTFGGLPGADGAAGIGYTPKGAWSSSTTYNLNESVTYLGSLYAAILGTNTNKNPATETTYWLKVVGKGDQGDAGMNGVAERISIIEYTDSHTLALADAAYDVEMNKGSANTLTIPNNTSVAFAIGTIILVTQTGAGITSITAAASVIINGITAGTGAITGQWKAVVLIKVATNTWRILGAIGTIA